MSCRLDTFYTYGIGLWSTGFAPPVFYFYPQNRLLRAVSSSGPQARQPPKKRHLPRILVK